jgi:thymidine phosphorylase
LACRLGANQVSKKNQEGTKKDSVDRAAGVVCRVKRGGEVAVGDVVVELHTTDPTRVERGR